MTHRHSTGEMHPAARAWHIKRRLRENGRIDTRTWALWVTAYIGMLEPSPWRTFCARELGRVTGDYATWRMAVAREREIAQERERLNGLAEAIASLEK